MKTVLLIRHGKSDWQAGCSDRERPLNARGLRDTQTMAAAMQERGLDPQFIFYSYAKRTQQTATLLSKQLNIDSERLISCPELYLCYPEVITDLIAVAPDDVDEIAIVAHNPSISEVGSALSHLGYFNMVTLAMLKLTFDTNDWASVSKENVIENLYFTPKD